MDEYRSCCGLVPIRWKDNVAVFMACQVCKRRVELRFDSIPYIDQQSVTKYWDVITGYLEKGMERYRRSVVV